MKFFLVVFTLSLAMLLAYEAACIMISIVRSKPIISETVKFERTGEGFPRILVIGDSTGVGTGANAPEESVAGRLGATMPDASIRNMSINGLRMGGLYKMLQELPPSEHYDLILLQIGGNDILRFTNREDLVRSTNGVLDEAKKRAETILFMSTGDIGNAPAFGPALSFAYHVHGQGVRDFFIEASNSAGVTYVDLYEPSETDPFAKDPWVYHAVDGLHPSSLGYSVWFNKLRPFLR